MIPPTVRIILGLFITLHALHAVPQVIHYQGRVQVLGVNVNGAGSFKFALLDEAGTTTYWSNDGTSAAGNEPTSAVPLAVNRGLYSVLLGDVSLSNMNAISNDVFANETVFLRIWFDDGENGSQLLTPDQRIGAVGYAMIAGSVPDGAITEAKIAGGAITEDKIADGAISAAKLDASVSLPRVESGVIEEVPFSLSLDDRVSVAVEFSTSFDVAPNVVASPHQPEHTISDLLVTELGFCATVGAGEAKGAVTITNASISGASMEVIAGNPAIAYIHRRLLPSIHAQYGAGRFRGLDRDLSGLWRNILWSLHGSYRW